MRRITQNPLDILLVYFLRQSAGGEIEKVSRAHLPLQKVLPQIHPRASPRQRIANGFEMLQQVASRVIVEQEQPIAQSTPIGNHVEGSFHAADRKSTRLN